MGKTKLISPSQENLPSKNPSLLELKTAIQKGVESVDLTGNNIAHKIATKIPKERYLSLEKVQHIFDMLRLI